MCLQSLHQHIGSRKWMAFEFWAHYPFNTLQLPPWIFIRVTSPCVHRATGGVVLHQLIWIMLEVKADLMSKDLTSRSPASWRGYAAYNLLFFFLFIFPLCQFLGLPSLMSSKSSNMRDDCRFTKVIFFFFSKSLPTKICPSDSVIGTDW